MSFNWLSSAQTRFTCAYCYHNAQRFVTCQQARVRMTTWHPERPTCVFSPSEPNLRCPSRGSESSSPGLKTASRSHLASVLPRISKGRDGDLKKRTFSTRRSTIKKTLTTVVSAFFINILMITSWWSLVWHPACLFALRYATNLYFGVT